MGSYKTGRTVTITGTGTITTSPAGSGWVGNEALLFWQANFDGFELVCDSNYLAARVWREYGGRDAFELDITGYLYGASIHLSASPDESDTTPADMGFSFAIPCVEWFDDDTGWGGPDPLNGSGYDLPAGLQRVYLKSDPTGTASLTVHGCGATQTVTATPDGEEILWDATAVVKTASAIAFEEDGFTPVGSTSSIALDWNFTYNGSTISVAGAGSLSGGVYGSADGTVSAMSVITPAMYAEPENTVQVYATSEVTLRPLKSYTLAGQVNAVDQGMSGVNVDITRFSGDTDTVTTSGGSFSTSYSQAQYEETYRVYHSINPGAGVFTDVSGSPLVLTLNEWAPVTAKINDTWCQSNGEHFEYIVDVDEEPTGQGDRNDDQLNFLTYNAGTVTLTQASTHTIDDCTSATNWTGMVTGGGGLQNTGTTGARQYYVRGTPPALSNPPLYMGSYRYIYLADVSINSGTGNIVVTLADTDGRSYSYTKAVTTTAATLILDQFAYDGASGDDTTDTRWPVNDPLYQINSASDALDGGDNSYGNSLTTLPGQHFGPRWGINYLDHISIAFPTGKTVTIKAITATRQAPHALVAVMPTYCPNLSVWKDERPGDILASTGVSTIYKCRRHLLADTDGVQNLEVRDFRWQRSFGGSLPFPSDTPVVFSIAQIIDEINSTQPTPLEYSNAWFGTEVTGGTGTGSGDLGNVYPGWTATTSVAANDSSGNVRNGFLNTDLPSVLIGGAGMTYAGGTFQTYIWFNDGTGASVQSICTSVDFYPNCGDVFALVDGAANGPMRLACFKQYRAQSWGSVVPADHQSMTLTGTGTGSPQSGVVVGTGTVDTYGRFSTDGEGLIGYSIGTTGPPEQSNDSQGIVTDITN